MRAATEGHLPLVMPKGNLIEVLCREMRKGSPGEPSRQRRPPCKTSKEISDEAADAAALTYLPTSGGAKGGGQKLVSAETAAQRDVNRRMTQTTMVRLKRRLQKTEMATATAGLQNARACRGVAKDKPSTVNLRSL